MHGDLAFALMIFGLITLTKENYIHHPPSSMIRSAIHRVMVCLIFVGEVGILGGNMWLWGADQLVSWVLYNEKSIHWTSYLTQDHFRDMTHPILALQLVFIGKCSMSSTYTTLNNNKNPHYNTILRNIESFIPKQDIPQPWFQKILWSWFITLESID